MEPAVQIRRHIHSRRVRSCVVRLFRGADIFRGRVSSWIGVCYLVRKLESRPPHAPGRYYRRRRNTGHPVPSRAVRALDSNPAPVRHTSPVGSEQIQQPRGPSADSLDRCPPPAPPSSPAGSEQTPQPHGPSVHSRVVHIACGAIGMRLLHMWGPSRASDPPRNTDPPPNREPPPPGSCIVCYDAAPETLLLPCRHLVLCEVWFSPVSDADVD